ncbi:MAG: hemolysin III family protein [Clostridiales bacterium]|nr:hemolysin III family protein [Clostridiales bacterium]
MTLSIKDPGSAITHFIGMLLAGIAATPLLALAASHSDKYTVLALAVFAASMILLYGASATYHTFNISEKANRILRKVDHMMIFILIAGSYTPVCIIPLRDTIGIPLLLLVWSVAVIGILIKAFWITCPKWFSSLIYISMGWLCVLAMVPLVQSLPAAAFAWLVAGGVIYTIGGIIYALKLPIFNARHHFFGSHEIFHLFVMAGSLCHYVTMFYIACM